jgi:hypothetical protein
MIMKYLSLELAQIFKIKLFFTGDIDNLKIWNRSLTANEVYSLFNNPEKVIVP